MQIITEDDQIGAIEHPWSPKFHVIGYRGGGISILPHGLIRNGVDEVVNAPIVVGRCTGMGLGSLVKFDNGAQILRVGRFVSAGCRLTFLLSSQHDMNTISTCSFKFYNAGPSQVAFPECNDSIVKNDVWIGDEVMMLGGGIIEDGCVIGARSLLPVNFRSEPYGIYAGVPAKLIRFRFDERIIQSLLELAWWDMPVAWIWEHNHYFLANLNQDVPRSLELLDELKTRRGQAHNRREHATA